MMLATYRRLATPLVAGARAFAAKGKAGAVVEEVVDLAKVVPTNILKDGAHPELKDKAEYPKWLFTLLDTKPTLGELERAGFDSLEVEEQHRYLSLSNRRSIKAVNANKAKK